MDTVEVVIKVTSPNLANYQTVNQRLADFTGDILGTSPVKQILQQDEINYVNEIKVTAQTEV